MTVCVLEFCIACGCYYGSVTLDQLDDVKCQVMRGNRDYLVASEINDYISKALFASRQPAQRRQKSNHFVFSVRRHIYTLRKKVFFFFFLSLKLPDCCWREGNEAISRRAGSAGENLKESKHPRWKIVTRQRLLIRVCNHLNISPGHVSYLNNNQVYIYPAFLTTCTRASVADRRKRNCRL